MPRGRKPTVNIVNGVRELLDEYVGEMVMPELRLIKDGLIPRLDKLEAEISEHARNLRELYANDSAMDARLDSVMARLDNLEKKP